MTNRGKGRFDRVGRPDVNPMLRWKVIEGQKKIPILQKIFRGFRIFGSVGFQKRVECLLSLFSTFRHPDLMKPFDSVSQSCAKGVHG